ncbi:aldehyde reductase [Saccharopolyspora sp. NPDC047091]|uniref:SDR family oxidoreductase n=1 Tax=Saccharopolyspora sp. NPDC047091 TaxID=3155924 RepID=UPI0033F5A372
MTQQRVLVTGGSGFLAGHCILQLLRHGYLVRTTVRSVRRERAVRAVLAEAGAVHDEALSFAEADLTSDAGWAEAVAGCDFVLHVASPVRPGPVADEDDLIVPAREGAVRVLRAARDAGVRRVVLTSAFHAVGWGHPRTGRTFTEQDWTVLDGPGVDAYGRSKTLAERAAWDFIATGGGATELVTMLPVAVVGPVLGEAISGPNHIIKRVLDGALRGFPDQWIPFVDVRDVAAAHVAAMTSPDAAGERFLLAGDPPISLAQVGAVLREHLGDAARHVPRHRIPSGLLRFAAVFSPGLRPALADLGYARQASGEKARRVLGWRARGAEEAIVAAAESLVAKSLVKP